MAYQFSTTDNALFAEAFFGSRFDHHVRAYYRNTFAQQIAALEATRDAREVEMAAGLRALRNRKLGE